MNLLTVLKYIFAATIMFDFCMLVLYVYFFLRRQRSDMFRTFILLFGCVTFWEILLWLEFFVVTPQRYQLFIDQLSYASGALVTFLAIQFSWQLVQKRVVRAQIIWLIGVVFFGIVCATMIPGVVLSGREYFSALPYNYAVIPGPLLTVFYGVTAVAPIIIAVILLKGLRCVSPLERVRALIVGGGLFGTILFAVATSVWIQLTDFLLSGSMTVGAELDTVIIQVSVGIFLSIFTISSAYAMGRYRFMDFHIILRKNVLSFILVTGIVVIIALVSYTLSIYIHEMFLVLPSSIPFVLLLVFRSRLKAVIDGFFFFNDLDISKKLSTDAAQLSSTKRLEEYLEGFVKTAFSEHHLRVTSVFVIQRQHDRLAQIYPKNMNRVVPLSSLNLEALLNSKRVLTSRNESSIAKVFGLRENAVFLPVILEDRIVALFSCQSEGAISEQKQGDMRALAEELRVCMGPLLYWYESIEGLKRKLHNDMYESV